MFKPTRENVKTVARLVIGTSAGFVTMNAIRANVNPENRLQKAELTVGSVAVGMIVSDVADNWVDRKVDAIYDAIKKS